MYFLDDIWIIIKDYLLHKKLEAIKIITKHAGLPYMLSLHASKGVKNNIVFLKRNYDWIFKILKDKQIEKVIRETERYMRD